MLEWVKSTVNDMRKHQRTERRTKARPEQRRARNARKKASLEAERARLMSLSEKELLVETLMTLQSWEKRYGKLNDRLEIIERNVEEVTEGILDLEFGITSLEP